MHLQLRHSLQSASDRRNTPIDAIDTMDNVPVAWEPLSDREQSLRDKHYPGPVSFERDVVKSKPGGVIMPKKFAEEGTDTGIYNFELRPDDIWIVTYPKCGTTWAQEMLWQLVHGLDLEGGKENLFLRSPFLEFAAIAPPPGAGPPQAQPILNKMRDGLKLTAGLESPRVIKTHLPMQLLPAKLVDTCKVVYVCRNPLDACVSAYYHWKMMPVHGFVGTFPEFTEMFKEGNFFCGDYWYHLASAWSQRDHPNMIIVWYEDMKRDLDAVIRSLSAKLGYPLSEATIAGLQDHLHVDNFKKNPAVNNEMMSNPETGEAFIRKGQVGDWKNHYDEDMRTDWMNWIEDNKKKLSIDADIKFNI